MDTKTLELLEFRKIQEILAKETMTPMGMEGAWNTLPVTPEMARERQRLGREISGVLEKMPSPTIPRMTDVRPRVLAATAGITLSAKDLKDILDVLKAFESLALWLGEIDGDYPELFRIRQRIPVLGSLKKRLEETVDDDAAIRDTASPKLFSIRRSYRDYQERIRRRAEEITRQKDFSQFLQEPIVTIRNGRYVIPVKQEYAARVQGIVHDQSASGQTLFVEPAEIVEMGNQLKRLELMERDEIERILADLSGEVGRASSQITEGLEALGEFDLGLAKARLLFRWKGSFPRITDDRAISMVKAWHPLLKGTPVPMDLSLSETGTRTVVITGPNMGGKTVALKTLGLLTAMALSGLPCPCHETTCVGKIDDILCDIGDEQSIEENLSTFSAHISNVVKIIDRAGPGKLVLIDELGAGTDPKEGAALAAAILNRIHRSGALCVVTSHYSEMKLLAQKTPGMVNASVEWDAVRMVPTFKLVVGRPGRSNAFLVARRLGLPHDVLDEARGNMQEDLVRLEDIIGEMEKAAQEAREEAERARRERLKAEELRKEYESRIANLEASRKEIISAAKREAQSIVARAKVEFETALKEIREKERISPDFSDTVFKIRERLRRAREEFLEPTIPDEGRPLEKSEIVPGKIVEVLGFQEPGVVIESPGSGDEVLVRLGAVTLRTGIDQLREPVRTGRAAKESRIGGIGESRRDSSLPIEKAKSISHEIDLRGMTREEAFQALDKYLDDAFLAALPEVRIIHGKGSGALRRAVMEYLETQKKYVTAYRLGEPSEGGTGVTIARLKS